MNLRTSVISVLTSLLLTAAALAQTSTDLNEGTTLSLGPSAGAYTFSWWGRAGRTYFLQQSDDLLTWTYLPMIESGADAVIQWGFTSSAPACFVRLEYTDLPTDDPFDDDFDGDGVSNWNEVLQNTDPLSAVLDTNGLPLDWERFYNIAVGTDANMQAPGSDGLSYLQAFQQGLNPDDYYDGQPPALVVVSGDNQTGNPGGLAPQVLVVQVSNADGTPLPNETVTFTPSVDGQMQASDTATPGGSLVVQTDANGQAQAFAILASAAGAPCPVTATVAAHSPSNQQVGQATFALATDDGSGSYVSPFAPTNFVSQGNPDGSVDMTWENHTDDQTPVEVEIQQADGSWLLVATLPPGTPSYHFTPSPPAQ